MWEQEKSSWPNHTASRFIEAAGIRWHVQQMGEGPALLLVHGTGASTHSWRDLLPLLACRYSVIAVDLPGHGFTGAVSGRRSSIAGMSEALGGLLGAMGVAPLYCVGHSAGAVVLCRMALDRRITPRAIVSLNGAFLPLRGAAGLVFSPIARLLAGTPFLPRLISKRTHTLDVERLIAGTGSKLDARGVELYSRLVRNPSHLAGALAMMGNWDLYQFERDLPRLRVPLVLMVGDNDLTVPPEQAFTVQQRVPHAVVRGLGALGHLAHEEKPEEVARELMAAFAEN